VDICSSVKRFLIETVAQDDESLVLTADTDLQESGLLDSISTLQLISFLEQKFNIAFESSDMDGGGFSSLRSIERLVNDKLVLSGASTSS
jgi:acyl carrier protein